jgi:hypothetical protein
MKIIKVVRKAMCYSFTWRLIPPTDTIRQINARPCGRAWQSAAEPTRRRLTELGYTA